jgi:hypothetical protein
MVEDDDSRVAVMPEMGCIGSGTISMARKVGRPARVD